MLRFLVSFFLTIFCFVLQSTVFPAISFGGIVPNLMIVLTASFGFMRGEKSGLLFGFFCGLLADIFFGSFIGLYALIYMYIGYWSLIILQICYKTGKFCSKNLLNKYIFKNLKNSIDNG